MRPPAVPPLLRNVHPPPRTRGAGATPRVPALAHALGLSHAASAGVRTKFDVGRARFELAVSWSQTGRQGRASLRPNLDGALSLSPGHSQAPNGLTGALATSTRLSSACSSHS